MTTFPVQGGCHCGAIRYTLLSPALSVQHCHCSRCRKVYGNLAAQGAVIRRSQIKIEGESNLTTYRSSLSFAGQFCKTCGCHLFSYEDSEAELMYLAPATLDGGVHPGHAAGKETHIHVGSKAEWEQIGGDLPQYETASPDEIVTGVQRA
jgi:hypothetical protein